MTTPSSITRALRSDLRDRLAAVEGVRAVYLFGSALISSNPKDIDLVVVYEPPLTPVSAPAVGPHLERAARDVAELSARVMFFSRAEADEPGILSDLMPVAVYQPPQTARR